MGSNLLKKNKREVRKEYQAGEVNELERNSNGRGIINAKGRKCFNKEGVH